MINFELCAFLPALENLARDVTYARYRADEKDGRVDEAQHSRFETNARPGESSKNVGSSD